MLRVPCEFLTCEYEQRHALGHAGVVGVPGGGAADGAVHLHVAAQDDDERQAVQEHDEAHVTWRKVGW